MNKTLSDLINEFLEYKMHNGYIYTTARYHLNKYLDFSSNHSPGENIPSKDTINTFLNRYAGTPGNLYNIVATLREFSRYLIGLGYTSAYVIPRGKYPCQRPFSHIYLQMMRLKLFLLPVTVLGTTAMFRKGISCCR